MTRSVEKYVAEIILAAERITYKNIGNTETRKSLQ